MDFETYLKNKKIDPANFQKEETALWSEFKAVFEQVHPDSFTAQKLFLINKIRRKYPLPEEGVKEGTHAEGTEKTEQVKPKPKIAVKAGSATKPKVGPKIKIKPKIKRKEEGN